MKKVIKPITSLNDLRALAALMVVISHITCTGKFLGAFRGSYAVSIFYILSSFLCMYTTEKQLNIKENVFYILKKVLKLIPIYYLFTIFTFIVATLKPELFNTSTATIPNLIKSFCFIPYQNANGLVRPILDVTWFLVLTFWFYVLFGISRMISNKYRGIISGIALSIIIILCEIFIPDNAIFNQYKSGIFSLILGILLYFGYGVVKEKINVDDKCKWQTNFIFYACFILCSIIYSYLHSIIDTSYIIELIPLLLTTLFIIFSSKFIQINLINIIATSSYSLYLVHEFIVKGFSRLIYNLDNLTIATFILSFVCLSISIAIGILINKFIEKPINKFITNKILK